MSICKVRVNKPDCLNPVSFLLGLAKQYSEDNNVDFITAVGFFLDKGIANDPEGTNKFGQSIQYNVEFCCPTCERPGQNSATYVLASVETFIKWGEAAGLTQSAAVPFSFTPLPEVPQCCSDVGANIETYLKYAEAFGLTQSAPVPLILETDTTKPYSCDDNFNACFQKSQDYFGPYSNILLDKGIVEYNRTWDDTNLCLMIDFFQNYLPELPLSSVTESIGYILDQGITIFCSGSTSLISSVETLLKYSEAVGLTQSGPITNCEGDPPILHFRGPNLGTSSSSLACASWENEKSYYINCDLGFVRIFTDPECVTPYCPDPGQEWIGLVYYVVAPIATFPTYKYKVATDCTGDIVNEINVPCF